MNFFIDTKLILDFLSERKPFAENANQIFNLAYNKHIFLYTSSQSAVSYTHL